MSNPGKGNPEPNVVIGRIGMRREGSLAPSVRAGFVLPPCPLCARRATARKYGPHDGEGAAHPRSTCTLLLCKRTALSGRPRRGPSMSLSRPSVLRWAVALHTQAHRDTPLKKKDTLPPMQPHWQSDKSIACLRPIGTEPSVACSNFF